MKEFSCKVETSCKLELCFKSSHPDPDERISKVTLPEVDGTNNEQEFITPVVACSGDKKRYSKCTISVNDHALSLTTLF